MQRVFLFAEPIKSLRKNGKMLQKNQEKSKEIEKSKDWRVKA